MAYKNKKQYISAEHVNEISEGLNRAVHIRHEPINNGSDLISLINNTLNIYNDIKGKMLKTAGDSNIKKFENGLIAVFEDVKSEISLHQNLDNNLLSASLAKINNYLDTFRRQGDIVLTKAKNDMFELFREVAVGDRRSYDNAWLRAFQKGEKFMSFAKNDDVGERYVYKGFMNQAILGYQMNMTGKSSIVVTKKELEEILTSKFVQDINSEKNKDEQLKDLFFKNLKGKSSLTSLFTPKQNEYYTNQDGTTWKGSKGKWKPTEEEIKSQNIQVHKYVTFMSHPVWAVEDLTDVMSDKFKESFEKLKEARMPNSIYFDKEGAKELDEIIDKLITKQIEEHQIVSREGGNRACYFPTKDIINVPDKMQFKNPVERYSTWVHELTHSTKHLLGRKAANAKDSPDYAFEELCAESTSLLMVKDLEAQLKEQMGSSFPSEWQEMFDKSYNSGISYNQGWGHVVGVKQLYEQMIQEIENKNSRFNGEALMGDVINALKLIQTGTIDGVKITPALRKEAMLSNFKKLGNFDYNKDNDAKHKKPEPESAMNL